MGRSILSVQLSSREPGLATWVRARIDSSTADGHARRTAEKMLQNSPSGQTAIPENTGAREGSTRYLIGRIPPMRLRAGSRRPPRRLDIFDRIKTQSYV